MNIFKERLWVYIIFSSQDQEESSELIEAIRNEANAVYEKFQNDVFGVPNEENFGHYFKEELKRFAVKNYFTFL